MMSSAISWRRPPVNEGVVGLLEKVDMQLKEKVPETERKLISFPGPVCMLHYILKRDGKVEELGGSPFFLPIHARHELISFHHQKSNCGWNYE